MRTATIVAKTTCDFATMEKADYKVSNQLHIQVNFGKNLTDENSQKNLFFELISIFL